MPASTLNEKTQRRRDEIERHYNVRVLEAHGCPQTGAGVVVGERKQPGGDVKLIGFYFEPRVVRRTFAEIPIHSNHERLMILSTLRQLLAKKKAAKTAPHDLKEGDTVACIWGHSMRDVRFWRVVDVPTPRNVELVDVGQKIVKGDSTSGLAIPENVDGPIPEDAKRFTLPVSMASGKAVVQTGRSIDRATLWNGEPVVVYSD